MENIKDNLKKLAIGNALWYRKNAILLPNHNTMVGASIYTKQGFCYGGFNVQNKSHKSYHAEELAILHCQLYQVDSASVLGIVISFSDKDITRLTFACGHCRQMLWEFTHNPDLLLTEVDLDGNIIEEKTLGELYPLPYPR